MVFLKFQLQHMKINEMETIKYRLILRISSQGWELMQGIQVNLECPEKTYASVTAFMAFGWIISIQ